MNANKSEIDIYYISLLPIKLTSGGAFQCNQTELNTLLGGLRKLGI